MNCKIIRPGRLTSASKPLETVRTIDNPQDRSSVFCTQETVHLPGQVLAARQVLVPEGQDGQGAVGRVRAVALTGRFVQQGAQRTGQVAVAFRGEAQGQRVEVRGVWLSRFRRGGRR